MNSITSEFIRVSFYKRTGCCIRRFHWSSPCIVYCHYPQAMRCVPLIKIQKSVDRSSTSADAVEFQIRPCFPCFSARQDSGKHSDKRPSQPMLYSSLGITCR